MNYARALKYLGCGCLLAVILIFCIVAGLICWGLSQILSDKPLPLPVPEFKKEAFQSAYFKLLTLPHTLKNSKPDQVETLALSGDEVNAIVILATHKDSTASIIMSGKLPDTEESGKTPYSVIFSNGEFQVYANRELPFSTPFGRYFIFRTAFVPSVTNSVEKIRFNYGKIGNISVPEFALESIMSRYLEKYHESPESAKVQKLIINLRSDSAGLNIQYHPYELKIFLDEYMKSGPLKMLWKTF